MRKNSLGGILLDYGKTFAFAIAAAFVINNVFIVNAKVPSGSMENTIMTGDRLIANRLAYLRDPPERFDVVVFKFPDNEDQNFVKRVIGLPGETVEIKDGLVYIDGSLLNGDVFAQELPRGNFGPFKIPSFHYFMLGDNRNNSFDSKDWKSPFVEEHKILGEAMFEYYPRIKSLKQR